MERDSDHLLFYLQLVLNVISVNIETGYDRGLNALLPLILVPSEINICSVERQAKIREKEFRLCTIHWYIVSV